MTFRTAALLGRFEVLRLNEQRFPSVFEEHGRLQNETCDPHVEIGRDVLTTDDGQSSGTCFVACQS